MGAEPEAPVEKPEEPAPAWKPKAKEASMAQIGRIDDAPFDCYGFYPWATGRAKCGSRTFDIVDERRHDITVQCVFCHTLQTVPADGLIVRRPDEFVFPEGLFAGKTIEEVSELEDGPTYLEFMARKAKLPDVAAKCRAWVDAHATAS
jgi:hypothetical protein